MRIGARLYERAASPPAQPASLWCVGENLALFAGPLGRNALHSHSVPVLLAGLYGRFRLRIAGAGWLTCRTAVVPAGIRYEFDLKGDPLGVLYLEPHVGRADILVPLVRNTLEINGAVVGSDGEISLVRQLYETKAGREHIDAALLDLLSFSKPRASRRIDPRIARIIKDLHRQYESPVPIAQLARSASLSTSRLQHLFVREVGVPLRRFRTWLRLRAAIREVARGGTYTEAAHSAGFYDQSHFSREFRRTFGAPASRGLSKGCAYSPTRRA